ncbi:hypothetical protein MRX96_011530 [Rhipicephalus microplus]
MGVLAFHAATTHAKKKPQPLISLLPPGNPIHSLPTGAHWSRARSSYQQPNKDVSELDATPISRRLTTLCERGYPLSGTFPSDQAGALSYHREEGALPSHREAIPHKSWPRQVSKQAGGHTCLLALAPPLGGSRQVAPGTARAAQEKRKASRRGPAPSAYSSAGSSS